NARGIAVGADYEPRSGSIVASTWTADGRIARLSPDDRNPSVAMAISNLGTIAGWVGISSGVNHAAIWQPSSQASGNAVRLSASLVVGSVGRASAAGSRCLSDTRSIASRQALFACVVKADQKR